MLYCQHVSNRRNLVALSFQQLVGLVFHASKPRTKQARVRRETRVPKPTTTHRRVCFLCLTTQLLVDDDSSSSPHSDLQPTSATVARQRSNPATTDLTSKHHQSCFLVAVLSITLSNKPERLEAGVEEEGDLGLRPVSTPPNFTKPSG